LIRDLPIFLAFLGKRILYPGLFFRIFFFLYLLLLVPFPFEHLWDPGVPGLGIGMGGGILNGVPGI
jgi:hypothetical protein